MRFRRREQRRTRCPYCHDDLAADEEALACAECGAGCHPSCWQEAGACATCEATAAAPRVPGVPACSRRGCRRTGGAEVANGPPLCVVHGARQVGWALVGAGAAVGLFYGALMALGAAGAEPPPPAFLLWVPAAFAAWGLAILAWSWVLDRTEPNEPKGG